MELKDVILQTLAEIEEVTAQEFSHPHTSAKEKEIQRVEHDLVHTHKAETLHDSLEQRDQPLIAQPPIQPSVQDHVMPEMVHHEPCVSSSASLATDDVVPLTQDQTSLAPARTITAEELFLIQLRDRYLVLFEGFLSPSMQHTEAKLDLTLNFLEYTLALIDERLQKLTES